MYKLHIRNYILIAEHLGLAQGNRNWTEVTYRHPQFQCMLSSSRNVTHILSALAASNLCAAPVGELIISPSAIHHFISFISDIYIAPLQAFYSEALPTTPRTLNRSFTPKRMSNCM